MVTKEEAIQRLRDAGCIQEANELDGWRDDDGYNRGWDGWIRGAYPRLVTVIWLDELPPRGVHPRRTKVKSRKPRAR